ncbi:MAG: hypothetical protein AB198_00130 [Parcubacteria bacterium C7867-003]|nr:MAG: hypothetical protein AB198_00130 [Parcubacteria bacterium C7867-003]
MKKLILNSLITAITLVGPTLALAEESGAEINTAVKVKASSTTQRSNPLKSLMEARREGSTKPNPGSSNFAGSIPGSPPGCGKKRRSERRPSRTNKKQNRGPF